MTDEQKRARRESQARWREANREHLREYQREWRKKNPEKVRAIITRYWDKKCSMLEDAE